MANKNFVTAASWRRTNFIKLGFPYNFNIENAPPDSTAAFYLHFSLVNSISLYKNAIGKIVPKASVDFYISLTLIN